MKWPVKERNNYHFIIRQSNKNNAAAAATTTNTTNQAAKLAANTHVIVELKVVFPADKEQSYSYFALVYIVVVVSPHSCWPSVSLFVLWMEKRQQQQQQQQSSCSIHIAKLLLLPLQKGTAAAHPRTNRPSYGGSIYT